MADFRVAHLAVGQANKVIAGMEQSVGVLAEKLVVSGFAGLCNGVAMGLGAVAPAVEDRKNNRF